MVGGLVVVMVGVETAVDLVEVMVVADLVDVKVEEVNLVVETEVDLAVDLVGVLRVVVDV